MPAFNLFSWRPSPRGRPSVKTTPQHTHDAAKKTVSPPVSKLRRAQQALIGRRRHRVSNRNGRVRVSFAHSSSSSGLPASATHNSIIASRHPSKPQEALPGPAPWAT